MDAFPPTAVVQTFLGLAILVFGWLYMYRKTRVDRYREDLFTLRDELFDFMWKQEISFDIAAHRLLRQTLNGAIRCAGDIRPLSFVIGASLILRQGRASDPLSEALDAVEDPDVRAYFLAVRKRFVSRFLRFLFEEGVLGAVTRLTGRLLRLQESVQARLEAQVDRWFRPLLELGAGGDQGSVFSGIAR